MLLVFVLVAERPLREATCEDAQDPDDLLQSEAALLGNMRHGYRACQQANHPKQAESEDHSFVAL